MLYSGSTIAPILPRATTQRLRLIRIRNDVETASQQRVWCNTFIAIWLMTINRPTPGSDYQRCKSHMYFGAHQHVLSFNTSKFRPYMPIHRGFQQRINRALGRVYAILLDFVARRRETVFISMFIIGIHHRFGTEYMTNLCETSSYLGGLLVYQSDYGTVLVHHVHLYI